MTRTSRAGFLGRLGNGLAMAVVVLMIGAPAHAVYVLYSGTMRHIIRTGQTPPSPPAQTPNWTGVLNVTAGGGITVPAGGANFASSYVVSNPPTFAGILQQSVFITVSNPMAGTARPGNGPGPVSLAFPFPTGAPPLNPTLGVSKRLGAISVGTGVADFGGTLNFVFNYFSNLVFYGGGGGAPNLACALPVAATWGVLGVIQPATAICLGLTTGPLPAMTLPSVMVPFHETISRWPAATGVAFAAAPAPVRTTTLTQTGSDMRNAAGTTGMLQLVAPGLLHNQQGGIGNPPGQNQIALISEWTFTLMPEPGRALLLLIGIAGVFALRVLDRRRFAH